MFVSVLVECSSGRCRVVTPNLADIPSATLVAYRVEAVPPDEFVHRVPPMTSVSWSRL